MKDHGAISSGCSIDIITTRKRSLGQGNILTPACHSVHRGTIPPWDQVTPGPGTPPRTRYTPPDQVHSRDKVHPRDQVHSPPPWDQVHLPAPRPGTPPRTRSPHNCSFWEIRATSGWYTSYWNVFLLIETFYWREIAIRSIQCNTYPLLKFR